MLSPRFTGLCCFVLCMAMGALVTSCYRTTTSRISTTDLGDDPGIANFDGILSKRCVVANKETPILLNEAKISYLENISGISMPGSGNMECVTYRTDSVVYYLVVDGHKAIHFIDSDGCGSIKAAMLRVLEDVQYRPGCLVDTSWKDGEVRVFGGRRERYLAQATGSFILDDRILAHGRIQHCESLTAAVAITDGGDALLVLSQADLARVRFVVR